MILGNRLYVRKDPDRDASLCIIYCEGNKREPQYFKYFDKISSRIILEVVKADPEGNNSPMGLYEQACIDIKDKSTELKAKYDVGATDQVWFVIDTDEWNQQIQELKQNCLNEENWRVAQSNPCFEVWLYYHITGEDAGAVVLPNCAAWKNHVNEMIPGGFDCRKHPVFIRDAIEHAKANFRTVDGQIGYGSTEMFKLAEILYPLVASDIKKALKVIKHEAEKTTSNSNN
ncbi:MAG: RloB domain-containing protein [Sphaerochaeta sp.]|jgi:hypothetical protein|nr:MAG: RloB domain-containing protein [Sphaerochaeta sp.]